MKFTQWLKYNKEGAVVGALAGAIGAIVYAQSGGALVFAVQEPVIGDTILNAMPWVDTLKELATTKFFMFMILIGTFIGAIVDSMWHPRR